jgi:chromosome segregation ATPase
LREIATIKKQKQDLEEMLLSRSVELTRTKENLNHHLVASGDSHPHQIEHLRRDNLQLRAELNEARSHLIARDSLIEELQSSSSQLNRTSVSSSLSAAQSKDENARLERELELLRNKMTELNKENVKLSNSLEISLKQNEADLIMAKKSADLSKHNLEKLQLELESERTIAKNLNTQIEQFKLQERLETKNQANLKNRIRELEQSLGQFEASKQNVEKSAHDKFKAKERELNAEINKLSVDFNSTVSVKKNLELKISEVCHAKYENISLFFGIRNI